MRALTILLTSLLLVASLPTASAFEISPYHNPQAIKTGLKAKYQHYLSRLTRPTHETLTRYALQCAEAKLTHAWCDLPVADLSNAPTFDEAALLVGTVWNDDPNNFFRVNGEVQWLYWLEAAKLARSISDRDPLEYRSHYGDLQYIHGMGNADRPPLATREDIMDWVHFAYDVATGAISPDAKLHSLENTHAFSRAFGGTSKRNWTVRKLFNNVGDVVCKTRCDDLPASDGQVAGMAMGALLHTVQDSFSSSHVERVTQEGPLQYEVKAWLDYRKQKASCHGAADQDVEREYQIDASPKPSVTWGAWVIRNAMLKNAWSGAVEDQLRQRVFKPHATLRRSDGGAFNMCEGKA